MEVLGGFAMMLSIIGFFLTVIWFILPLVIFNIKGRVDRTVFMLEEMDKRLASMERALARRESESASETTADTTAETESETKPPQSPVP